MKRKTITPSKAVLALILLILVCGSVEVEEYPHDTRNYFTVESIELNAYKLSDNSSSLIENNIISLSNWNIDRYFTFYLHFSENNLPEDDVSGGGGHGPFGACGTRYDEGGEITAVLKKEGDNTRDYGISNLDTNSSSYLEFFIMYADSDITTGNYYIHILDGEDVEFYVSPDPLVIAP
ncbi:MAG: hypothetical protein OEZ13_08470 [Spirochaetia bacterium]|nr:hypothetical protein [Spirochaetia bacterium]